MTTDSPTRLDDAALLVELEPEVHRLYDRHAGMAQEWFPHEFIPYRLGRDFDKEPWTPDQPRLTGVAQIFAPRDIVRRNKFRYDKLYIRRRSFSLDVKLILLSFWITFRGAWETRGRKF